VSDPSHHRYGQHLSKVEVENLIKPSKDTSALVTEWLQDNGIDSSNCEFSPARDWVTVALPVAHIERLLETEYSTYKHDDGDVLVRTTAWSLPVHLHEHISTIQPTTAFLRASPKLNTAMGVPGNFEVSTALPANDTGISAVCNFSAVTTTCLRTLYNTINYEPQVPGQSQIGFNNFLGQVANRSDTSIFLSMFRPEAVGDAYDFTDVSIAGGPIDNGTNGAGAEANLDVETITGLTWPIPVTSYSTGGSPPFQADLNTPTNTNEPYLTWLNYVLGQSSVPQVISTSYGDDEQTVPYSYASTVCNSIAQLGARGVSVLFSSGDFGVGANGTCLSNDGKNTSMFLPVFPASCPYVTAVGGTYRFPEEVAYDPRNGYASGSGFSNYFPTPEYQKCVVEDYISELNGQYDGFYNKSGRAYPDVSAQSFHHLTIYGGKILPLDGTSCSCPTTSSIVSLVNDALLAAGKSPLGWLNPWLYTNGSAGFNDVVAGTSIGCNVAGFEAKPGWDVPSGWGTPDFTAILKSLGL